MRSYYSRKTKKSREEKEVTKKGLGSTAGRSTQKRADERNLRESS